MYFGYKNFSTIKATYSMGVINSKNHAQIDAHAFVCVGSGYWGHHALWYRPLALFFWHGWGAYSLRRYGYLKTGGGWTGRSLPKGVFTTWRRWCHQPEYYLNELASVLRPHHFEEIRAPIRSFIYQDDPIASLRTGEILLRAYPAASKEIVLHRAAEFGLKSIGHGGPFTKKTAPAAAPILDWLDRQCENY